MALAVQSGVAMSVTELQRTGSGAIQETQLRFEWNGVSHSSAQGPLKFRLGTKIVRREMPGSSDVVHHAMSASWQPFTVNGEWRDIWMGQGQAFQTYLEFARLAQRMPLVRITLDSLSFVGMLEDFEVDYEHESYIKWSFVISPEENENVSSDINLSDTSPRVQRSIQQHVKDTTDEALALQSTLDDVDDLPVATEDINDVQDSKAELDSATASLASVSSSSGIEGISADLVSNINNVGSDVTDLVWTLPKEFERLHRAAINVAVAVKDQRADTSLAFDDFLNVLRFENYVHETTSGCWRIAGKSSDAARDLRSKSSLKPRAIYVPKPGESLERISMRFYGTPDNANLIYRTNHLTSLILAGTEELLIPDIGA